MKNLKKILLSLMVLFLAFAFIGCPAEPDPVEPKPETPETPVNNFNGKTFIGMEGEGEDAGFASYIIFTSDKNCEVCFYGMTIPATYTVADDVATLTGTGNYATIQLSTTELTNGTFKITVPPAVSKEEKDIVVSYAVGTLWTVLYDIPDSDEDFSLKMPEEELGYYVQQFKLVDGDYTKNDETNTITLTASGWEKVKPADPAPVPPQPEDDEVISETWTVLKPDGSFLMTFPSLDDAETYARDNELNLGVDFEMKSETQTITLTASGWEKVKPADPEPVVPVNNFKGNVYVMTTEVEEMEYTFSWIIGYVEFTDDTNGKVVLLSANEETNEECLDELPFSYTVEDDVATMTIEGETESFETSKLENDAFTFEFDGLSTTCKKGDTSLFVKGNLLLDGIPMNEEEMYLATLINNWMLVEEDYVVEDGNLVFTKEGAGDDDEEEDPPADDEELPETWEKRESFEGLDGTWAKKEISGINWAQFGNPTVLDSEEYFRIDSGVITFGVYLELDYNDVVIGYANQTGKTEQECWDLLFSSLKQPFGENSVTSDENYVAKVSKEEEIEFSEIQDVTGYSELAVNETCSKFKLFSEDSEGIYTKK